MNHDFRPCDAGDRDWAYALKREAYREVVERQFDQWNEEIQLAGGWRGRGLGTTIIKELLATARSAGKPLRLQVLRENHRAKRLYLRLGFIEAGGTDTHFKMVSH